MPQTMKMRILNTSRINRYMIELFDPSSWLLSVQKTKCATYSRMFVLVVKHFFCLLVVIIELFFQSKFRANFFEVSLNKDLVYVFDTCGKNVTSTLKGAMGKWSVNNNGTEGTYDKILELQRSKGEFTDDPLVSKRSLQKCERAKIHFFYIIPVFNHKYRIEKKS